VHDALKGLHERLAASSGGSVELTPEEFAAIKRLPSAVGNPGNPVSKTKTWTMAADERLPGDRRKAVLMICERDGDLCGICGTAVELGPRYPHPASASIDHIDVRSQGGPDVWGNVRLTHLQCNRERNEGRPGLTPEEALGLLTKAVYEAEHPEIFLPLRLARYVELAAEQRAIVQKSRGATRADAQRLEVFWRAEADKIRARMEAAGLDVLL